MKRSLLLVLGLAVVAIAALAYLEGGDSQRAPSALADGDGGARAVLRNAAGGKVGKVKFSQHRGGVQVKVTIDAPLATLIAGFHGFHVHEAGTCDPNAVNPAGTPVPFLTAGFHLDLSGTGTGGTAHPNEAGDMPVLLVNADGTAEARFTTDRFTVADLLESDGTAIIIHEGRDNYANIPSRYLPPPIDQATLDTGDAGARKVCGIVEGD